jgi:hypothetical protein
LADYESDKKFEDEETKRKPKKSLTKKENKYEMSTNIVYHPLQEKKLL